MKGFRIFKSLLYVLEVIGLATLLRRGAVELEHCMYSQELKHMKGQRPSEENVRDKTTFPCLLLSQKHEYKRQYTFKETESSIIFYWR